MLDSLQSNSSILVLSPHLDDAVLSVGGIVERAGKRGIEVVVGTICTAEAPAAVSASATVRRKHADWGLGPYPYSARRQEDIEAVHVLGARYLHGEQLDAIYRTDPAGGFLYPSPPSRFSYPLPSDPLPAALGELLIEWIRVMEPAAVLCPLGVGRHVDHVITSQALRGIALQGTVAPVFLYEDMPYSAGYYGTPDTVPAAIERSAWTVGEPHTTSVNVQAKIAAVRRYKSQISSVFPDGRDVEQELKDYMLRGSTAYSERVWAARP